MVKNNSHDAPSACNLHKHGSEAGSFVDRLNHHVVIAARKRPVIAAAQASPDGYVIREGLVGSPGSVLVITFC